MKVAMQVEDRDTAYLFLDATNVPEGCQEYELVLKGVAFEEITSDECIWLESVGKLEVVPRDSFDFENDPMTERWPIPSPIIVLDKNDLGYSSLH
jgi:hypothetical protein